ncbi:MAG: helix-turn-helix transcriptional regulator [Clostridia bacterium]|nr:helix-turn-helix transcriptional regulator [Clostridia bacterium]
MKDIKSVVSANLGALRKQRGITQAELAEKLNYSDKAISRWEKGDTLPDLNVLYEICQFYCITMNDLVSEECIAPQKPQTNKHKRMYIIWMCILAGVSVWLFATIWFVVNMVKSPSEVLWIAFLWAIPFSCGVVMMIGRTMFNWIVHFILGSVTVWSSIVSTILHILFFTNSGDNSIWFLLILGVPLQAMLFLFQRVWKSRVIVKTQAEVEENANRTEESNKIENNAE